MLLTTERENSTKNNDGAKKNRQNVEPTAATTATITERANSTKNNNGARKKNTQSVRPR